MIIMNDLKKTVDGGLKNDEYYFTPTKENEKDEFCIINIWPGIIHPDIKDSYLKGLEAYTIGRESLNKGQVKFELYLGSREELHNVFMYFSKKGYKHIKISKDDDKNIEECRYTLNFLYESNQYYFPNILGSRNIMSIVVCTKNLIEFKKDLQKLRPIYGYRIMWEGNNIYSIKNIKIID